MGKAHLVRFGGRKRGKGAKGQLVTIGEGEMENKKLKHQIGWSNHSYKVRRVFK